MSKIAIITDSTCDLSQETLDQYHIKYIPLRIVYPDRDYRDRIEISPETIYSQMPKVIPKTSLPTPEDALAMLDSLVAEGYTHICGVFISSGLSGTFNMLNNIAVEYTNAVVEFIDSKSLSMGLGFPVLTGAKAVLENKNFEEVIGAIRQACMNTKAYYVIKTLEYLKAGGRIGKVEGTIGELLDIKPIISVNEEGVYYTVKKVRGRKKSMAELIEIVKTAAIKPIRVGVLHGGSEEEALEMKSVIEKIANVTEVFFNQISPVLTVHTGPGLLAVVVQKL